MSSRGLLIGLGVLVIAGLIVAVVSMRSGDKSKKTASKGTSTTNPESLGDDDTAKNHRTRRAPPPVLGGPAPTPNPRTTVRDNGTVVRDHRTGTHAPMTGNPPPPQKPFVRLNTKRVVEVRKAVDPKVRECEQKHSFTASGPKPKLDVSVLVNVAGDRITISESRLRAKRVDGAEDLIDCVRAALKGVDIPAKGHVDLEGYRVSMGFHLSAD